MLFQRKASKNVRKNVRRAIIIVAAIPPTTPRAIRSEFLPARMYHRSAFMADRALAFANQRFSIRDKKLRTANRPAYNRQDSAAEKRAKARRKHLRDSFELCHAQPRLQSFHHRPSASCLQAVVQNRAQQLGAWLSALKRAPGTSQLPLKSAGCGRQRSLSRPDEFFRGCEDLMPPVSFFFLFFIALVFFSFNNHGASVDRTGLFFGQFAGTQIVSSERLLTMSK